MDRNASRLQPIDIGIILLTLATAVIHFTLVFPSTLFILNALGYLALLAALYLPIPGLPFNKDMVRWALIGYTAVTIFAWFFMGGSRIPLGYITKVIELALIVLLVLKGRADARSA
jgi:hypothetical protein